MSFASDVQRFARLAKAAGEKIMRETEIDLYSAITFQTPVKTGRARGNWFYSTDSPSSETSETGDLSGAATVSRMRAEATAAKFPRIAYLTNNLPYIERLEDGWSGQAPAGMVRINIARARAVFASKVRRYKV